MNSFTPLHKNHGIEVASIVLLLEKPLADFHATSKNILENQSILSHQQDSRMIKIRNQKEGPNISEEQVNGFVLKSTKANPKQLLHAYNEEIRTIVIYLDYEYNRWSPFFDKFKEVFNAFCNYSPPNQTTAIALEYVDKFNWNGDPTHFKWNKLFREDSDMLSQDFHKHTLLSFQILRERILDEEHKAMEQLVINRDNERTASIRHHVSMNFKSELSSAEDIRQSYYKNFDSLHAFNKQVLRKLLNKPMAKRVGL